MRSGLVVDASVALSWGFDDEDGGYSDRVLDEMVDGYVVVPSIWRFEVANGLAQAIRSRRSNENVAVALDRVVRSLEVHEDPVAWPIEELARTALQWRVTPYDASYVILAHTTGLPLATQDRAMRRAATAVGVPVFA